MGVGGEGCVETVSIQLISTTVSPRPRHFTWMDITRGAGWGLGTGVAGCFVGTGGGDTLTGLESRTEGSPWDPQDTCQDRSMLSLFESQTTLTLSYSRRHGGSGLK